MTSVFLVRPKLSQPWDEQFIPCCIICFVLALRAQLVIRKQGVSDDSLLLCSSLQAPEVEPARRQSCIWPVFRLGSHGRHQSPWLRIIYWRASEREHSLVLRRSLLESTLTRLRHVQNLNHHAFVNCRTVVMNLLGQPNSSFVFHKPSLLSVSKALVRSAKVTKRSLFCSWHFSPTVELETLVSL